MLVASLIFTYSVLTTANEWMEANYRLRFENNQLQERMRVMEDYCQGMTGA